MLPLDVTPAQQRLQDERVRQMTTVEKARALDDLCSAVRQLAEVGIRQRQPGASPALVRWLLAAQIYGEAVALRVLGDRPDQ